ncbi:MAG: ABC transporter permease [Dehalococcoidia bacterium]|nr:ABC transporter permease [Dehalococcoidia bacterium]
MTSTSVNSTTLHVTGQGARSPFWRSPLGRVLRIKLAVFGLVVIGVVAVGGLLAPVLAPYPPNATVTYVAESPSWSHLLGTDSIGRDQLSRLLYGARVSLTVSVMSAVVGVVIGGAAGLAAARLGGIVDSVIMRIADGMLSLPGLVLPLAMIAAIGGGVFTVALTLGISLSPSIARLMRGQALAQLERDYVLAAHSIGVPGARIMLRHVAPNCVAPIIVAASLGMSSAIGAEAALSFLGAGVTAPTATWGNMLSQGLEYIRLTPWMIVAPGVAVFLLILSLNFLGDALRDVLDPRLRGRT